MNIGVTHDGRITPIFEERLRQVGTFSRYSSLSVPPLIEL